MRLHEEEGAHVVSTDEKTGIQALERLRPALPMRPGKVECHEHEYVRHGTQCLIASFEVATGKVITPSIGVRPAPMRTSPPTLPRASPPTRRPSVSSYWTS